MNKKGLYIGATNQNVGKTTVCLGVYSALRKQFDNVGFIKPVGQKSKSLYEGILVDKDVALFRKQFHLNENPKDMSPVLFHRGYTKQILDGQINCSDLKEDMMNAYSHISKKYPFTLVEGTGHMGVGSIAELSCAEVASDLGLDVLLITTGGIGSTFDDLILSKTLCQQKGVKIKGVIINKVLPEKKQSIQYYVEKALKKIRLPLLGCIEYNPFLSSPTMEDFEFLFDTKLLSAQNHERRHWLHMLLATGEAKNIEEHYLENQLIILNTTRNDLIKHILKHHPRKVGLIFTGITGPSEELIQALKKEHIPAIYAKLPSFIVMEKLARHIAKIQAGDTKKIHAAIELVEKNIDIKRIVQ